MTPAEKSSANQIALDDGGAMKRFVVLLLLCLGGCAPIIDNEQACAELRLLFYIKRANGELEVECTEPRCPWTEDVTEAQRDACFDALEPMWSCAGFHDYVYNEC